MKILFISDFNINQDSGGAQVSNDIIINKGLELGYNITQYNYDSSPINLIYNYDLIISSNLNILCRNQPNIFNFIINHHNHIRIEHDSCIYLNNNDRKSLFESSKINFFLSDFHIEFFTKEYGNYFKNVEIVYDPIDTNLFNNNNNTEKIYDIVYCGYLSELKGYKNLIKFCNENPERKIDIFGWAEHNSIIQELSLIKNITIHDKLKHNKISNIFKKSNYIYHYPILNEPFCRMASEALLCGCKFIGNESKIGGVQEYIKQGEEKFKQNCQNASNLFWQKIKYYYNESF